MIVIKDVEVIETDRDLLEILTTTPPWKPIYLDEQYEAFDREIVSELVKGRKFVRPSGKEVVIGLTKKMQELLEIGMDCWDRVVEESEHINNQNYYLKKELDHFKNLNFLGRAKYFIFGYKKPKGL